LCKHADHARADMRLPGARWTLNWKNPATEVGRNAHSRCQARFICPLEALAAGSGHRDHQDIPRGLVWPVAQQSVGGYVLTNAYQRISQDLGIDYLVNKTRQSECILVSPAGPPTILSLHSPQCGKAIHDALPRPVRLRPFSQTGHLSRPSFFTAIVIP
jgi:hypothetical protein